ncbi:unnamed protein product [Dovyalis caffra]|uniref:Uncharacterized protein n=1 Tax=Dovyalis caffra TaxID=77055 RepID=A0AAV1R6J6_9ROSI|nr:unnamed protein product [Dovyalis caffra]
MESYLESVLHTVVECSSIASIWANGLGNLEADVPEFQNASISSGLQVTDDSNAIHGNLRLEIKVLLEEISHSKVPLHTRRVS